MTRVRGVGRVEGVRVDPLSMTVSRGAPTIGSRLSRKGERGARPDRSLREQSQDARGRRTARTRSECRARDDGTPKRTAGVNRQRSSRVGNAARSGPDEGIRR